MSTPILELINFSKHYRSHWTYSRLPAVDDTSFSVDSGEAFGYLGPNGAGKTTTIKCIAGLIQKSAGRILIDGHDISGRDRAALGYLPELPYFYDHLTVEETLSFFAALYGIGGRTRTDKVSQTLDLVHLSDRRKSPVRSLSKGLQQRLGLAQAIINRPRLLLLDEPFSGLDPIGRLEFRKIILDMKSTGTTILLSSHILSDVESICDRVAIMAKGKLKTVFRIADSPKLFGELYHLTAELPPGENPIRGRLTDLAGAPTDSHGRFSFVDYGKAIEALKIANDAQIKITEFKSSGPDLETVFMKITTGTAAGSAK